LGEGFREVLPELEVADVAQFLSEMETWEGMPEEDRVRAGQAQEAFLDLLQKRGRTPEVETLVRALYEKPDELLDALFPYMRVKIDVRLSLPRSAKDRLNDAAIKAFWGTNGSKEGIEAWRLEYLTADERKMTSIKKLQGCWQDVPLSRVGGSLGRDWKSWPEMSLFEKAGDVFNTFLGATYQGVEATRRYAFNVLLPSLFPSVQEGGSPISGIPGISFISGIGMPSKVAQELGLGFTAKQADWWNAQMQPIRDEFREISTIEQNNWDDFLEKNPQFKPKPQYNVDPWRTPDILKDTGWWLNTMASTLGTMVPAITAGTIVTATTKNPWAGAAVMAAAFTPIESMELYDDLIEHGAPEERARELALQIGAVVGAVEMAPDLIFLKAVFPAFKLFQKGLQKEIVKATMRQMIAKGIKNFTAIEVSEALEEVLQEAIKDYTVKFWDENRDIISNIPGTFITAIVAMAPMALFGVGMSMRSVSPHVADITPSEVKLEEGWEFNEITGQWFKPAPMVEIYEDLIQQGEEQGLTQEQAKVQALNEMARRPEVEEAIQKAVQEVARVEITPPVAPMVKLESAAEALIRAGVRAGQNETKIRVGSTALANLDNIKKPQVHHVAEATQYLDAAAVERIKNEAAAKPANINAQNTLNRLNIFQSAVEAKPTRVVEGELPTAPAIPKAEAITPTAEVAPEVPIEDKVKAELDELVKMYDYWQTKIKTLKETKASLAKYVRENLPLDVRGKFITAVAKVETDAQLEIQMAKVRDVAERNAQKVLRVEIHKELKKARAKIKDHVLKGKFTPETQGILDTIRHNLKQPREMAMDKIADNMAAYERGEITWDQMSADNEILQFSGIKEMNSIQLAETLSFIKILEKTGRSERQAKREAYIERIQKVRDEVVNVASGGKGVETGVYAIPKSEWQKGMNLIDRAVTWMNSWDYLMEFISKFHKIPFDSPIYRFGRRVHDARERQYKIAQGAQANGITNIKRIFDEPNSRKMARLIKDLRNEKITLGEFQLAEVTKIVDGETIVDKPSIKKTIRLTKGQMMTMYNLLNDPTLDTTFRKTMQWTDEIMDAVRNNLTPQEKAFADWTMEFMKNDPNIGYDAINAVYSEMFGVDLPNNPYYFPGFRDVESQIAESVLTYSEAQGYAAVLNDSLKTRIPNIRALKFNDIFDVLTNHINRMAHFMAFAETMRDMRAVFGNRTVQQVIDQYYGEPVRKEISKQLSTMARDGVETQRFGSVADWLRGNAVRAQLSKPVLLLKQIPSILGCMTEMPAVDFVKYVADYWIHPMANYKFMLERSPYLRERFGVGFERDVHFANQAKPPDFLSGNKPIKAYFTEHIKFGDKFAVVQGMWAKMKSELAKKGLTLETATEEQIIVALDEAKATIDRTQPAFALETLSAIQSAGAWMKLFTMYQTQPAQYFRMMANNYRNFLFNRGSRAKALSNILIVWVIIPMLWQFIADAFQWKKEHQMRAIVLGPMNWYLIVGQLAQSIYGWAVGESYDYQASPIYASITDLQNLSAKIRKMIRGGQDPYKDIAMDDVVAAIEFFGKAIGQITGYPTPYLAQVSRAQRLYWAEHKDDPNAADVVWRLIYSDWALQPPTPDIQKSALEASEGLGEVLKDSEKIRAEYGLPDEYNTLRVVAVKYRNIFSKTLLTEITTENGFDPLTVLWAEMEIARQLNAALLPDVPLYEINTDEANGLTIIQLKQLWDARSRLTRLPEIVEFDKIWSDVKVHHGNVTRRQYELLVSYLEAEDKEAFLISHPELKANPRKEWIKANPRANALLALWGYSELYTIEAYNEMASLIKDYDIPDTALVGKGLPPSKEIAEAHFKRMEIVEEFGAGSLEDQLFRARNPELVDWLNIERKGADKLNPITTPIASLELKTEKTYRDIWNKLKDTEYLDTLDNKVKDEEGLTERGRYIIGLKATRITDEYTYIDIERKIEAIEIGTIETPTPDNIVEAWVERYRVVDQYGSSSSQALVWLLDNLEVFDWAVENNLLKDGERKTELLERENILRINVEIAGLEEGSDQWIKLNYKKEAYNYGLPDNLIDTYVEYCINPKLKKPDGWEQLWGENMPYFEDDWWLMEHMEFYDTMVELDIWEDYLNEKDKNGVTYKDKVPTKEVFELYKKYLQRPLGQPRKDFRALHLDLDAWGVIYSNWKPIEEQLIKEPKPSPWEGIYEKKRWIETLKGL